MNTMEGGENGFCSGGGFGNKAICDSSFRIITVWFKKKADVPSNL